MYKGPASIKCNLFELNDALEFVWADWDLLAHLRTYLLEGHTHKSIRSAASECSPFWEACFKLSWYFATRNSCQVF